MLTLVVTLALVPSVAAPQVGDVAIEREIALRGLASSLTRSASTSLVLPDRSLPIDVVERSIDRVVPESEPWVRRFAVFDAAARAGLLLSGEGAFPDANERPEIWAGQVRTFAVGDDLGAFQDALEAALAAPFSGVREAALDRITRALIDDERVGGHVLLGLAASQGIGAETQRELSFVTARTGVFSSERVHAAITPWLPDFFAGRGEGSIAGIDALFDEWLPRPLGLEGIQALRSLAGPANPLVEALALVAVERDGIEHLTAPSVDAVARLFLAEDADERAELVARHAASPALGRALLAPERYTPLDEDARLRSARAAAWSLPLAELLDGARTFAAAEAIEVWTVVASRPEVLPVEAARPWIRDPRDDVRETVAREIGRRVTVDGDAGGLALVDDLLADPSAEIRSLAFAWICDAGEAVRYGADLRAAFDAEAIEGPAHEVQALSPRQTRWLARLPRDEAVPVFRDVLVALVADRSTRDPAVIELLGPYRGDADIVALLERALAEELEVLVGAPGYRERLVPDGRGAALVRTLSDVRGPEAVPTIVDALRRSMEPMNGDESRGDARPQLPKTACALLARTAPGRAALEEFLSDDVPRRVRYESALQLSKSVGADQGLGMRIGARLVSDHGGVDGTLRMRGIAALGRITRVEDPIVDAFLGTLATGARGDDSERQAAIASLGQRAALELVLAVARGPLDGDAASLGDLEAAVAAARALGDRAFDGRGVIVARATLELLRSVDARLEAGPTEELQSDALDLMRGALLVSLCGGIERRESVLGSKLEPEEVAEILRAVARRPIESGRADIASRFDGVDLGDVRFRWHSELEAAAAHHGADALLIPGGTGAAAPTAVDGRLLLVLGDIQVRAARSGNQVEARLQTGLFAVEGEPRTRDAERDLALGRAALARAHLMDATLAVRTDGLSGLASDDWDAAALQTIRLLIETRRGRVRRQILEAIFQIPDPAVPRDAEARLAALARILRARAVLGRSGDTARAGALADAARTWARLDAEAAAELAALDEEIARRDR